MVKVLFGDRKIDIGKGNFIPVKVYCKQRGMSFRIIDNWIFNGDIEEGVDYIEIPDLDMLLIRDKDYRKHKRVSTEERKEIFAMLDKGHTFAMIGRKFGITRGAVYSINKRRSEIKAER